MITILMKNMSVATQFSGLQKGKKWLTKCWEPTKREMEICYAFVRNRQARKWPKNFYKSVQ